VEASFWKTNDTMSHDEGEEVPSREEETPSSQKEYAELKDAERLLEGK
jgi:hypothetical protein